MHYILMLNVGYLLYNLNGGPIKAMYDGSSYISTINLFIKWSFMHTISCHYIQSMECLLSGAATKAPATKAPDDQFLTLLTLYS